MSWDDDKNVNPGEPDGELTADEWDAHVQDQKNHSSRHENSGSDELDVSGLSGVLADPQTPQTEAVHDIISGLLDAGDKITLNYDDPNDTLTIGTDALDSEEVEDTIGGVVTGGSQVTATYDDAAGTVTISIDAPTQSEFDNHSSRHEQGGSDVLSIVTDQIQSFGSSVISSITGADIEPSSVTTDSVSAEQASISGGYRGTFAGPTSPELQSARSTFDWSNLAWEDKGSAIIDGSASDSPDGAGFQSLLHAGAVLDNPIDEWYMYWAGHDSGSGIYLSTASDIWGPWSFHGKIWTDADAGGGGSHVSSPHVLVDYATDKLLVYYHHDDSGQRTKLATAPLTGDGTNLSNYGVVIDSTFDGRWDEQERSYFYAQKVQTGYVGIYQGRDRNNNPHGIGIAWSLDGREWTTEGRPAFDNTAFGDYNPTGGASCLGVITTFGGRLDLHYFDDTTDVPRVLPFSHRNQAQFTTGEQTFTLPSWATGKVFPQDFVTDQEHLYTTYTVNNSGTYQIGISRTPLEAIA